MRITNAWVDDPLRRGQLEFPKLCVQVDELPDPTIPEENFDGGWLVGKYGPFVKYSNTDLDDFDRANAGSYNVRFAKTLGAVVDISLFYDLHSERYTDEFALSLKRARQLVRKHDSKWRLLANDSVAQSGGILWLPVESNSPCKFFNRHAREICGAPSVSVVKSNDFDIPYCINHVREYNERRKGRRQTTTSQ